MVFVNYHTSSTKYWFKGYSWQWNGKKSWAIFPSIGYWSWFLFHHLKHQILHPPLREPMNHLDKHQLLTFLSDEVGFSAWTKQIPALAFIFQTPKTAYLKNHDFGIWLNVTLGTPLLHIFVMRIICFKSGKSIVCFSISYFLSIHSHEILLQKG